MYGQKLANLRSGHVLTVLYEKFAKLKGQDMS